MNIDDELFFSPKIRSGQLTSMSEHDLLKAYKERIIAWYIEPSRELNKKQFGFGSALILLSLIDALARYLIKKNKNVSLRYIAFVQKYLELDEDLARKLYDT